MSGEEAVVTDKQRAYVDIKQRIIREEFRPGQWLIERELSETYGLSRTPMREILRNLVSDGLLELQPAKGYTVRKLSIEEVSQIFQAREAVEGLAAHLACQRRGEKFTRSLGEIKKRLGTVDPEQDTARSVSIGNDLHNLIVETADNFLLNQFYQKLKNLAGLTRNITKQSSLIEKESQQAHLSIVEALEEEGADKAEQLMREHLRTTCRLLLDTFNKDLYPPNTLRT